MKHIKKFENFKINEISQSLANRAMNKSFSLANSDQTDQITKTLKHRQGDKFKSYIDPKILELSKSYGFSDLKKEGGNKKIFFSFKFQNQNTPDEIDSPQLFAYIIINNFPDEQNSLDVYEYKDNNIGKKVELNRINSNILRKLKRFFDILVKENHFSLSNIC